MQCMKNNFMRSEIQPMRLNINILGKLQTKSSGNSETQVFKFSRVQLKVKTVKSSLCEVSLTPGEFDVR